MKRFEKWIGARPIDQEFLEQFLEEINAQGKSTKQIAAALKYRYVKVGKLPLDFTDLAEASKNQKPHQYLPQAVRTDIDQQLVKKPKMRLACRLLYDLAARSQDLPDLTFSSFVAVPTGGANVTWKPRKQKRSGVLRKCFVPRETMLLVNGYQKNQPDTARLYPHSDVTMNSMLGELFKEMNSAVSSHDFRHTKLTDIGAFLTAHDVRDYAGHSSIRVTDKYLHSN